MRRRPVIGITLELEDHLVLEVEKGLRAPLQQEGAFVIALPRDTPIDELDTVLEMVDGVVFSGGADVDPSWYGHEPYELTVAVPAVHDLFEITLARRALELGMPVLGLCRGAQVLAVADGGTLTQDVATLHEGASRHAWDWYGIATSPMDEHGHEIRYEPDSRVAAWIGDGPPKVNSFHHQCVRTVGSRLRPVAWSLDGVIEATERCDGGGFAVGLQWHNEMMWRHDERFLQPHHEFTQAAWDYAAARDRATDACAS
jgi:putative glutamine amidotransferase